MLETGPPDKADGTAQFGQVWTGSIQMSGGCFHHLKLSQFRHSVDDLHERVSVGCGRVEITADDCDDACVLISKAELEALEHALAVLARSEDYRAVCAELTQVAGECLSVPCHAPCPQTM